MNRVMWLLQGVSGLLLLAVLGMHFLANHTTEGLLSYDGVLQRFQNPTILAVESVFLVVLIYHAFNGLRGVLVDYVRSERWNRLIARVLTGLGAVAAIYGLWLGFALSGR